MRGAICTQGAGLSAAILIAAIMPASEAGAQWTITNLHPAGASASLVWGMDAGHQVGRAFVGGQPHASLWSGTAGSWIDLHPEAAVYSDASGVQDGQQVGWAYVAGAEHAALWTGTAASWMDINPTGATWSNAYEVMGGQQVGFADIGGQS